MRAIRNLVALIVACSCMAWPAAAENPKVLEVSLANIVLPDGERIVGFEIHIEGGVATRIELPKAWAVDVTNDENGSCDVSGKVLVGAGALSPAFFEKFVRIRETGLVDLHITMKLRVTADFERTREVAVAQDQIVKTSSDAMDRRDPHREQRADVTEESSHIIFDLIGPIAGLGFMALGYVGFRKPDKLGPVFLLSAYTGLRDKGGREFIRAFGVMLGLVGFMFLLITLLIALGVD